MCQVMFVKVAGKGRVSDVARGQPILGGVAHAENVDRLAVDCEQDAVDVRTTAMQQFAKFDAEVSCFVGREAAIGVVRQTADRGA